MKVPNMALGFEAGKVSLSRLQNEGSQLAAVGQVAVAKSIKVTE